MKPKKIASTPSEMVISAVHSLCQKNGSSPQDIVRFISGKYKIDSRELKSHVCAALKRCATFGLLSQESGLYRLKEINEIPSQIIPVVPSERARRKRKQKQLKKRRSSKKRVKRKKGKGNKRSSKNSRILVQRISASTLLKKKKLNKPRKSSVKTRRNKKRLQKRKNSSKNLGDLGKENGNEADVSLNKDSENVSKEKDSGESSKQL